MTETKIPKPKAACLGSGEGQVRYSGRGRGSRSANARGTCRTCGKNLALTSSGRIPRHVPAKTGAR